MVAAGGVELGVERRYATRPTSPVSPLSVSLSLSLILSLSSSFPSLSPFSTLTNIRRAGAHEPECFRLFEVGGQQSDSTSLPLALGLSTHYSTSPARSGMCAARSPQAEHNKKSGQINRRGLQELSTTTTQTTQHRERGKGCKISCVRAHTARARAHTHTHTHTRVHTHTQPDRQTDIKAGRQAGRQIHRHTPAPNASGHWPRGSLGSRGGANMPCGRLPRCRGRAATPARSRV